MGSLLNAIRWPIKHPLMSTNDYFTIGKDTLPANKLSLVMQYPNQLTQSKQTLYIWNCTSTNLNEICPNDLLLLFFSRFLPVVASAVPYPQRNGRRDDRQDCKGDRGRENIVITSLVTTLNLHLMNDTIWWQICTLLRPPLYLLLPISIPFRQSALFPSSSTQHNYLGGLFQFEK